MANYFKRKLRMEKCARLEAQGIPDKVIAAMLRLSRGGLATLKRDPAYANIRVAIATGVVAEMDTDLAENREFLKTQLKQMVPTALRGLFDLAVQRTNERVRLEACKQILNRDGLLAEVSKSQVTVEDARKGASEMDDNIAAELIAAFRSAGKPDEELPPPITETVQ